MANIIIKTGVLKLNKLNDKSIICGGMNNKLIMCGGMNNKLIIISPIKFIDKWFLATVIKSTQLSPIKSTFTTFDSPA